MSDLDDKLREILDQFTVKPMPDDRHYKQGQGEIVAQIKQAFADEGYRHPGAGLRGNLMTGQEWYNRFVRELANDVFQDMSSWMAEHVLEAAKKAAGLDS